MIDRWTATLRWLAAPTLALAVLGVALPLSVATAALPTSLGVITAVGAMAALRTLGGRMTLWCLFVGTIPLREPLSVDVVGTKTIYLNDVLLLPLVAMTLHERGGGEVWRRSSSFRIGILLLAAGVAGLYTATRWVWAVNFLFQGAMQVGAFYVAWHEVRDARHARWTLLAFLAGMIPATLYGFYQSTLSLSAFRESDWTTPPVAWSVDGTPIVRVYSAFEHPLSFSHALSVSLGLCLGWLFLVRSTSRRVAAGALAAIFLYCNQLTYSLGGLLGSAAAIGTAVLAQRRRRILLVLPLAAVAWLLIAPPTFVHRADQILRGDHTSLMVRLITYGQALEVLRDHPLLGVGWGNVGTAMEGEYRVVRTHTAGETTTAENYFLTRAMALGGVGLALVLILCFLFYRNVLTRPPPEAREGLAWPRAALLIAGTALYVQAQTQPTADAFSRYILWIFLALAERMRAAYRDRS